MPPLSPPVALSTRLTRLTKKQKKNADIIYIHILGLESLLNSTEGFCTQTSTKGRAASTLPSLPAAAPEKPVQRAAPAAQLSPPGEEERCPVPCRAAHHKGVPELLSGSDSFRHQIPPVRQES